MAKKRKRAPNGLPWYWKKRDYWCVPGDAKKSCLRDKHGEVVHGAENAALALAVWHEMMSVTHAAHAGAENQVKFVLDLYLQDMQRRKVTDKTLTNYTMWFQ